VLNKDLKNALNEIKKLTVEYEELKNKVNEKLKKDKYCLAGSENEFIQVRNCNSNAEAK
jgi:FtsZ-binding cell division protein ZapB